MRMMRDGKDQHEILTRVHAEYSRYGPGTTKIRLPPVGANPPDH